MSKDQMIEQIRHRNQTASTDFLGRFNEEALQSYLQRLTLLHDHRGKSTAWVREGGPAAVTGRYCA